MSLELCPYVFSRINAKLNKTSVFYPYKVLGHGGIVWMPEKSLDARKVVGCPGPNFSSSSNFQIIKQDCRVSVIRPILQSMTRCRHRVYVSRVFCSLSMLLSISYSGCHVTHHPVYVSHISLCWSSWCTVHAVLLSMTCMSLPGILLYVYVIRCILQFVLCGLWIVLLGGYPPGLVFCVSVD